MQRYLPGVSFADPGMAAVTVRQLLHQTSGIPADAPRADAPDATLTAHVEALRAVRLVAPPGGRHIYSSPNYQLLGRIVELVSGESFGAYVQRRILDPADDLEFRDRSGRCGRGAQSVVGDGGPFDLSMGTGAPADGVDCRFG